MAETCGFNPTAMLHRIDRLAGRVLNELDGARAEVEAIPAGGHPMLQQFIDGISKRCRTVQRNLTIADDSEERASETGQK